MLVLKECSVYKSVLIYCCTACVLVSYLYLPMFHHSALVYSGVVYFFYPKTVIAVDLYPSWHCTSQVRQWKELFCFMCSGNSRYTKCSGKLLQSNYVGMVSLVCDQVSHIPMIIWCWWPLSQQWLYAVFLLSTSLQRHLDPQILNAHSVGSLIPVFEEKTQQFLNLGKLHQEKRVTVQCWTLSLTFA